MALSILKNNAIRLNFIRRYLITKYILFFIPKKQPANIQDNCFYQRLNLSNIPNN